LVTRYGGIPVTSVSRTLADIRGALPSRLERRARRQAEVLGLPLGEVVYDRTRSDLESAFLRLCRRHRLRQPEVNAKIAGFTVDFLWRSAGLVVETDGYRYHRGRVAFENDRARDLSLRELGFDVIRVADRQLEEESPRVAALVADALRLRLPAP
jgi:very-short-patch-repair endonuclease